MKMSLKGLYSSHMKATFISGIIQPHLMKLLSVVLILVLLGGGSEAMITIQQQLDRYEANVGETVMVLLNLTNAGDTVLNVEVLAELPEGILAENSSPSIWSGELLPGADAKQITYNIIAEMPGEYEIYSKIVYSSEGGEPVPPIRYGDIFKKKLIVS